MSADDVRWEPRFVVEACPQCMATATSLVKRVLNSLARTMEERGADEFPREEVVRVLKAAADSIVAEEISGPR